MNIRPCAALVVSGLLAVSLNTHAANLNPVSVMASGSYSGNLSNLTDGYFPPDTTLWNATPMVAWTAAATSFVFDFGSQKLLQDVTLTVDNNDFYFLQVSNDGVQWNALTTVMAFDGLVNGGMDTFSSQSNSPDYSALIDFQPQTARYVRLSAVAGDGLYSAGEVSFSGVSAVPEPEALVLMLAGVGVAAVGARRRLQG